MGRGLTTLFRKFITLLALGLVLVFLFAHDHTTTLVTPDSTTQWLKYARAPRPPPPPATTLFCWSVICPGSTDEASAALLARNVLSRCDSFAIYSNISRLRPSLLPATPAIRGSMNVPSFFFGWASNSALFISVYKQMVAERRHMRHTWIVKVDPDAVVVVPRLRRMLATLNASQPLVLGGQTLANPLEPGLQGAIIPMSGAALRRLAHGGLAACERMLPDDTFSEDMWLQCCATKLEITAVHLPGLRRNGVTDVLQCGTPHFAAFHGELLKRRAAFGRCAEIAYAVEDLHLDGSADTAWGSGSALRGRLPCEDTWAMCDAEIFKCGAAAAFVAGLLDAARGPRGLHTVVHRPRRVDDGPHRQSRPVCECMQNRFNHTRV